MSGVELFSIGTTAVTLGDAALVVGSIAGAVGSVQQGRAAQAAADHNARLLEVDAANTRAAAQFEEDRHREKLRRALSSQRAATGASGLSLEGSPLLVVAETAADAELDALGIRFAASTREASQRGQAASERLQGRLARQQGLRKAGTTLLSGVSKLGAPRRPRLGGGPGGGGGE